MMKYYILVGVLILMGCKGGKEEVITSTKMSSQVSFETVDYEGLEEYLETSNATVQVVNFWATWCQPCVKELPYFEKVNTLYADQDVDVILVSLDFPDHIERLSRFIEKHNIQSEVVFLDDGDANNWIPKVDVSWSGAIPATIIYTKEKRSFYERSFTYDELEKELKLFL
ncbi:TlpA disulfide reductase family protein [Dokdonia sp.]|uniref:TlpA family protein disulfide reductase n=1 Tax=Dokdonia sp. TaxID=2024995 RepID=UPI003266D9BB